MKRLFVGGPLHGELRELSPDEYMINALESDPVAHLLTVSLAVDDPMGRVVTYWRTQVVVTRRPGGYARRSGTARAVHLFTLGGKEPEPWELVDAMMIAFRVELGVEEHKA